MPRIPVSIRYILSVFMCGMGFFTLFRLLLIAINTKILAHTPHDNIDMYYALFMGVRFDTVVSGYLLILPTVILLVAEFFKFMNKGILTVVHWLICFLYAISFLICATDVPFFSNFNSRLNLTVLNWTNSPVFMIKMVWQDHVFFCYFLLFIAASIVFSILIKRVLKYYTPELLAKPTRTKTQITLQTAIALLFITITLVAIRGRTSEKSPINVGTAYFCDFDFANQAGLNPVFTFMQSWLENQKEENKQLHLMDDAKALQLAQHYLHVTPTADTNVSPISRTIAGDSPMHHYNVVVVIMESMSWCYLQRYGNQQHLTPYLDSLASQGYSFDNFYSAGIHTFNGIFSVLYSYPALLAKHTMLGANIPHYTGLPWLLKNRGYETMYFTTHDDQFDNVGGFLTANHFNQITSQKDYPSKEVMSTLGVPDHYMFNYSLPILNSYAKQQKPFLAVYMTAANHPPYIVPQNIPFKPAHTDVHNGCVEYTDWSIRNFIEQAKTQLWFNNTIFVFTGDHGVWEGVTYGDLPISYNHISCIIYGTPLKDAPRKIMEPGGQIDIFPTIAGILGGPYTNSTPGIDLLHDHRPYIFFSQDDRVGVATTSDLYIWHKRGGENYYNMSSLQDIISSKHSQADSMRQYAFCMLQTSQWLLLNKQTGKK